MIPVVFDIAVLSASLSWHLSKNREKKRFKTSPIITVTAAAPILYWLLYSGLNMIWELSKNAENAAKCCEFVLIFI